MAYATTEDVAAILPEDEEIPAEAYGRVEVNLEEATDLVIGYLHREYTGADVDEDGVPDDVPDAVRRTVARVTMRVFLVDPSQPGAESEVNLMGPFSHTINWSKEAQSRDFYLTDSDEAILDRFVTAYNSGVAHFPMYGDPCATQ
jgi:hypothetical protein